ncbi:MAG: serine/threonine-protein kinase [Planctomycetota bacterium]
MPPTLRLFRGDDDAAPLRIGSRLDKYRLTRRLGEGGFATVYAATDLIENRQVALKIPYSRFIEDAQCSEDLHREVRIIASMQHTSIVPLKDARFIDGHFVMVFPLGRESLADRLTRRIGRGIAMDYAVQMVAAVAHAHSENVLHRDIKPDNFILFDEQHVALTDFGLARIENGRHDVSGSGTLGFIAPEQAMGKPTFRSDVFSLGLVLYYLFSGEIPEYPFDTLPGFHRLRRGLSAEFVGIIRKSIDPAPTRRFRDAVAMNNAIAKIRYPLADRSVVLRDAA